MFSDDDVWQFQVEEALVARVDVIRAAERAARERARAEADAFARVDATREANRVRQLRG